jgi:hypothetical protein
MIVCVRRVAGRSVRSDRAGAVTPGHVAAPHVDGFPGSLDATGDERTIVILLDRRRSYTEPDVPAGGEERVGEIPNQSVLRIGVVSYAARE